MKDLRKPKALAWAGKEDDLQIKCAEFAKKTLYLAGEPQVFHHCPSGGRRSKHEASKFKLMGVIKGVPDLFLPLRSGEYCGLYIELKNAKGKLADSQVDFMMNAAREGYLCMVINDLDTFKTIFSYYIKQRKQ